MRAAVPIATRIACCNADQTDSSVLMEDVLDRFGSAAIPDDGLFATRLLVATSLLTSSLDPMAPSRLTARYYYFGVAFSDT